MPTFKERLSNAWNAFTRPNPVVRERSYYQRPDRLRPRIGSERSIVAAIYNRIAVDCAAIEISHVKLDENERFVEKIDSRLNYCLAVTANLDQTGRALIQDLVMSMCDEGCVALVPVGTTVNPYIAGSYDITNLRVGKITQWYPSAVRVSVYNERTGEKEELIYSKRVCAIIENPLYAVMNEPNSTLQRLIRKLSLLDYIDEQHGSNKLDLIIQLPYVVKSEAKMKQAQERRKQVEMQLAEGKYGIAYIDGTERVIQLNRSLENNLLAEVEYLTKMLFSQLGLTEEVFNGTADEKVMLNYYNRTIEPIMSAITLEMKRKFLTKTAITQRHSIEFFRDPFKLVPVNDIAEIADKFTRNAILSSNELRVIVGYKPVDDQVANELSNKNLNRGDGEHVPTVDGEGNYVEEDNGSDPLLDIFGG